MQKDGVHSDSSGSFIHGVEYSSDWYKDDLKSKGGWSLEMIDIRFPFYYQDTGEHLNQRKEERRVCKFCC